MYGSLGYRVAAQLTAGAPFVLSHVPSTPNVVLTPGFKVAL
jgi:hypothetical protein